MSFSSRPHTVTTHQRLLPLSTHTVSLSLSLTIKRLHRDGGHPRPGHALDARNPRVAQVAHRQRRRTLGTEGVQAGRQPAVDSDGEVAHDARVRAAVARGGAGWRPFGAVATPAVPRFPRRSSHSRVATTAGACADLSVGMRARFSQKENIFVKVGTDLSQLPKNKTARRTRLAPARTGTAARDCTRVCHVLDHAQAGSARGTPQVALALAAPPPQPVAPPPPVPQSQQGRPPAAGRPQSVAGAAAAAPQSVASARGRPAE